MRNKALQTVQNYNMIQQGDRVLAAVSGGADSVALLHFLWTAREALCIEVEALHLNHQLRGEESDRDERFVRDLCASWGVKLGVKRVKVDEKLQNCGLSLEACARECRYRFFDEMAAKRGAKVATAHTLTDNVETVLINLTRGTALRGLSGIPPVRGPYVRPLLECTRADVEAYCAAHELSFVTDSTNAEPFCTRNRIRHEVYPLLERENPSLARGIAGMTELLRQDADYLDALAQSHYRTLHEPGGLPLEALQELHPAMRGRVLRMVLEERGIAVSRDRVELLWQCVREGRGAVQVSDDWIAECRRGHLQLARPAAGIEPFSRRVRLEDAVQGMQLDIFSGKSVRLRGEDIQFLNQNEKKTAKLLKIALDCDKMGGILNFRQFRQKDRLRLPGRGCAKTLKNLFQEAGTDPAGRARRIVLADDGGVKWVEGFGPDASAAVDAGTRRILILEVME